MIDLLVVDDHSIFRAGLKRLVSDENDIRVVDEASDATAALTKVRNGCFDVVILDVNMTGRSGFDLLESIRADRPNLPVIILSMYPEEQYAVLALRAGANAYLSKDVNTQELINAIRQVSSGGRFVTARSAERVMLQMNNLGNANPHVTLSPRELQIMLKMIGGVSLTEIGVQLCISVKTVGTYRTRILEKLGLSSNAELVQYAMRHRLID